MQTVWSQIRRHVWSGSTLFANVSFIGHKHRRTITEEPSWKRSIWNKYSRTINGSNIFWTMENCLRQGSSSHWGLIMMLSQKANGDNLGKSFRSSYNNDMLRVLIRIASLRRFYRVHTYNFMIKLEKKSLNICFFLYFGSISWGLKNEFELAMVNELSVLELLRFECTWGLN